MAENPKPNESAEPKDEREMSVNNYGQTRDSAVVVEDSKKTVLLTDDETIIIEKDKSFDLPPNNRPRKIYAGMWGTPEIISVGLALLAVLAAIVLYIFFVLPAQGNLETKKQVRNQLEQDLISAQKKYGTITDTETQIAQVINSIDDFERRLPYISKGQVALYQRINGLIGAYGLVNTSGPDYAPLQIEGTKSNRQSEAESGRAKFQSLFPGVYVTMTVEGSYQNLRRFIREVETSTDQFVMISAIEIEPTETQQKTEQNQINPTQAQQGGSQNDPNLFSPAPAPQQINNQPAPSRGKTHGETVALRIELAAYFSRQNVQTTGTGGN